MIIGLDRVVQEDLQVGHDGEKVDDERVQLPLLLLHHQQLLGMVVEVAPSMQTHHHVLAHQMEPVFPQLVQKILAQHHRMVKVLEPVDEAGRVDRQIRSASHNQPDGNSRGGGRRRLGIVAGHHPLHHARQGHPPDVVLAAKAHEQVLDAVDRVDP